MSRDVFDAVEPLTIGLEEEAMLLDPATFDLAPVAEVVRARVVGARVKLEMPASQLETVTPPARRVGEAIEALAAGRRALAAAARGLALPAVAGAHPFAAPLGELNVGERYDTILAEHGDVARSQLVCALHVHIAVGGADRTLAVYNAMRAHLPELAALAANAPFHVGRDTGLASVRPLIAGLLPRQGIPPAFSTWDALADALHWGALSGIVPEPRSWWWEMRPHVLHGTLELRVPDGQTTLAGAAAVAAFAHALVAWLAERHDAGEVLVVADSWRIEANRWIACRHGVRGDFVDLVSGERRPVQALLCARLEELAPVAARLGCAAELAAAAGLVERGGAARQRAVAGEAGLEGLARWLADAYLRS